ncbi:MAG: FdtA/QdtA family cupin domain-containing protein [Flavobacteriaceae bacterium]|nr:FdtA/QdtA family cupin domain-containing protein [Flavobacteriaceae bacterium]
MTTKKKFKVSDCKAIDLPKIYNEKGSITVLENNKSIPFNVERVYYLYDVPSSSERGGHAHYELEQYIIAACGSFTFILDDGTTQKEVFLNNPSKALHIKKGIWREIKDFSSGAICLVLASHTYDEKDYIRNYEDYLKYTNNG